MKTGVGAVARQEDQRTHLPGAGAHGVEVQQLRRGVDGVGPGVEEPRRDVEPVAVGQVAAGVVVHPEQALADHQCAQLRPLLVGERGGVLAAEPLDDACLDPGGEHREEGDKVGVGTGVRLDVGVRRGEQLARQRPGVRLDGVHVVAAGVEPVTAGALGVLVGQQVAVGQLHSERAVVLTRDELDVGPLVDQLLQDRVGHRRVHPPHLVEGGVEGDRSRIGPGTTWTIQVPREQLVG